MRFEFGALPWELLGRRPVMVTLTYPGEWEVWVPDARTFVRHREALKERWRRRYGTPIGVWVTEFQKRGAPHLHMYLALPDDVSDAEYVGLQQRTIRRRVLERQVGSFEARRQMRAPGGQFAMWLRTAWWEVVGSDLKTHHGRGVDIAAAFFSEEAAATTNRVRVAEYFWRESGKWAQKEPPEGFGSLKFYGRWGQNEGFKPVVSAKEMDERVAIELRRMLRRLRSQKMREAADRMGGRWSSRKDRIRGRDGLTVFGVDGRVIGPRLVECAEAVVLMKTAAQDRPMGAPKRLRPELVRAFSELEMPEDDGMDAAVDDPPEWVLLDFEDEEARRQAALFEAEEEARQTALREKYARAAREVRKLELRRAGGWRGAPGRHPSGSRRRP